MRVITFKAKPKFIFGAVMAIVGIVVIVLSFIGNHSVSQTVAHIDCSSTQTRVDYIESLGWKCADKEDKKQITIPTEFNSVYNDYNKIQKQQGFDLSTYKGKTATLYTYHITNYSDNENVVANLIVVDGKLVGADLCDTSADNGFLVGLKQNDKA